MRKRLLNWILALGLMVGMLPILTVPAEAAGREALNITGQTINSSSDIPRLIGVGLGYTYSPGNYNMYYLNRNATRTVSPAQKCPGCGREITPAVTYDTVGYTITSMYCDFQPINNGAMDDIYNKRTIDLTVNFKGSFSSYSKIVLQGKVETASACSRIYRGGAKYGVCPNSFCNRSYNYTLYEFYGYRDENDSYTALTSTSTRTEVGSASSVTFSNCTFNCYPPGLDSKTPFAFYNCTFKNGAPVGSNITLRGCTGSLTALTDQIDLNGNPNLTLSRWANYDGTKYSPQSLIYQGTVVTLKGAASAAAKQENSLTIVDNSGVAWTDGNYREVTISSTARTVYLRVARLPSLTNINNLNGELSVNSMYTDNLSMNNFRGTAKLYTSECIDIVDSSINHGSTLTGRQGITAKGSTLYGNMSTTSGDFKITNSNIHGAVTSNQESIFLDSDCTLNAGATLSASKVIEAKGRLNIAGAVSLSAPEVIFEAINAPASSTTLNVVANTVTLPKFSSVGNTLGLTINKTPVNLKQFSLGRLNLNVAATDKLNTEKEEMPTSYLDRLTLNSGGALTAAANNRIIVTSLTTQGRLSTIGSGEVIIDGGTYSGSPAVTGSNVTVKRGTFTDTSGTSQFLVDPDSEMTVSTSNGKTISVVKLTNPPIIIDWADFPGIDLSVDLAAPVIEVLRNPSDSRTPTDKVTLTIRASDPNGNDDPKPISINGGAFQASPATYVCTENQIVSIVARDSQGNVREYQATVSNIDANPPEITGFTQSTEAWTKDPIRVYVNATDDVKLNLTPYKFEFQPNTPGSAKVVTGWQADRSFQVTENGTLWAIVRDTMGKETRSDPYYIRNIDKIAPTANYELSPPAGAMASAHSGVTIELSLVNTGDPITEDGAALATTAVKWSDTEAWSSDLSRTVFENGTYNIRVRDAVGNVSNYIPITVSNISTDKPVIDSLSGTHLLADFVQAPVTLTAEAHGTGSTPLAEKPYSWDGGKTWTSLKDFKIYQNGEYTVVVRDATGNQVEASIIVSNIDATKPTASVYLFKGLPADDDGTGTVDDYVWKVRIEADDIGSGIDHIETLWDGGTHTSMPIIQDIVEPGVYGIIVYDKAGNQTYAEKTVTAESIGESTGTSNNAYVDIKVPSSGSGGDYFGASIGDLVYGPTGAYNRVTSEFKSYQSGAEGITANIVAGAKRGTWLTGYATFNSVRYPVTFSGAEGVAGAKGVEAQVFIPISGVTTDVRNGRLVIVLQEWDDSSKTTLKREGSATLYTSVQVNQPRINYTYNKATDEMTMVSTSAVAGIKSATYNVGGSDQAYSAPFNVGGAVKVVLTATDNVNNVTSIELDGATLPVAGDGGGTLPTEGITEDGVNSYYIAGRSSEAYIIGGTRSNTNNVPSSEVFEAILGQ